MRHVMPGRGAALMAGLLILLIATYHYLQPTVLDAGSSIHSFRGR
jgi:hypothetical protein